MTAPKTENTIWMIVGSEVPTDNDDGAKGDREGKTGRILSDLEVSDRESLASPERDKVPLEIQRLKDNMSQFLSEIGDLLVESEQQAQIQEKSEMQLDEIQFSIAVNGQGEVGFWGFGGKVGGATEIKLTFKRKQS